jgi:hypothetical protein
VGDFEAPSGNGAVHPNGAAGRGAAKRTHAPWEFLILSLFVALVCIGIILGWTIFGSKSPERLSRQTAAQLAAACDTAQSALKALPNPNPVTGADRVARIRAEDRVLGTMVQKFTDVDAGSPTKTQALRGWTDDWSRTIEAREQYAAKLEATRDDPTKKVQFILPTSKSGSLKPATSNMDDYVRESHPYLDACFTEALQLDVVEGPREYKKVTQ